MDPKPAAPVTVFLFGDQTDSWVDGIDQLYRQASSTPWLKAFLDELAAVITAEARTITLDRAIQDSLGHFSSLQELGERYRHEPDQLGVVRCLLLHTVRAGTLLQWVKREPHLFGPDAHTEWVGISGGLLTLSALAIADDFETLHNACLEIGRMVVRVCKLTSVRSRAVEDGPGVWGWAVLGIRPDDLRIALDRFQRNAGIPSASQARVGVTGSGWSTVIGPPSVLNLVINQCPEVKGLARNPLEIKAIQHTLTISSAELDFMVGNNATYLDQRLKSPNHRLWGMDDPAASHLTWGDQLRAVCLQVLSRPLDLTQALSKLKSKLDGADDVRILQIGSSSHAPYLASVLRAAGRDLIVLDQAALRPIENEGNTSKAGRIAIVGMAGRGPGSDNVEEFWNLIMAQQDMCQEVPKDRFNIEDFYCSHHERGDQRCKMSTKYGCFMEKPGHFDSRFFHISPREAMLMDPGHRQFLMSSYEALEMAGYSAGQTRRTDPNRIATFLGQCTDDWYSHSHPTLGCDAYTLQGVQRAFGPGRLAWQLKWEGPTYSLDSACAGTTAAIHLAAMSLISKDIDMAVAGAANILSTPHSFASLSDSGVLSDTGNCKTFRDDADGYCRGDYVGAVVLKRLEDAIAHNDNILAVVAATGRNHSGNSSSITTSDAHAQERLFKKIMRNAQVSPDDISYVEMHGTGTQIGDPAEMSAVANTFKHRRRVNGPLPVGGVKANFGHSEAAAGMAELIKCIMMFKKDIIPPQAGMPHALNPRFPPLSECNIEILSNPKTFKKEAHQPRRILLNNFDAAGGNACMLLEDYVSTDRKQVIPDSRSSQVIVTSARTKASYQANKVKLITWLQENPAAKLEDIAYSTTARRVHHPFRFACTVSTTQELVKKLEASGTNPPATSSSQPPIVFVFTGQGSHYAGMGAELYRTSPVFRETVDLCMTLCESNNFPLFLDIITAENIDISTKDAVQVQLAVITLEVALTAFWRSVGIEPAMVMGHSLGEYAALHAAGVLSLADTLYLVGNRAKLLLERCEPGACAMLSLSTSVAKVRDHLVQSSSCSIACINSPNATVVSGTTEDLAKFQSRITTHDAKVRTKLLPVPFAFHSFQMDPLLEDYVALTGGVTYSAPKIPVASTLLASVVTGPGVFNQDYLGRQMRQTVDFVGGLNAVNSSVKNPIWLEIGPGPVCSSFVRTTLAPASSKIMHSIEANTPNWTSISETLSAAYMEGVEVDWLAFHAPYESNLELVTLPAYAWDMKDYWVPWKGASVVTVAQKALITSPEPFIATCAQYVVSKTLSPKIQVTFRASISDAGFMGLIQGHKMQQIGLASGSVFCDAAATAAKYAIEYSGRKDVSSIGLTLHDPELLAPLTKSLVGLDGELFTTATMDDSSADSVLVSFRASSARTSHDLGSIRVKISNPQKTQAEWDHVSYFIKAKMDERIRSSKEGSGHRMQPQIVYALFANAVEFDPAFKGIQEAYVAEDFQEAAAVVVLPNDPSGTRFTFSPYWGEALVHLAGFMVNGNPKRSPHTTFIVMGFESTQQTVAFVAGKTYLTYTRISRWEKDTAFCDAFVFDPESSKLVMQCINLRYTELPRATWRHILDGGHTEPKKIASVSSTTKAATREAKKVEIPEAIFEAPLEAEGEDSNSGIFDLIVGSIARSTGSDPAEFTDDTVVSELGVDSIMAIEIVATVKTEVEVDLPASFIFNYPTIGDLRRAFGVKPSPQKISDARSKSASSSAPISATQSPEHSPITRPESTSSLGSSVVNIESGLATPEDNENVEQREEHPKGHVIDTSPLPSVRITLLQGRPSSGKTPFYLMADGTGSIATYIHLPTFKSKMPVYGIDSPFLRCPSRLTSQVGIPGVAKLIVEALLKAQPKGSFCIGGFSAGCMVAFEVCRQLGAAGRKVDGLVLIDLCCPRPTTLNELAIREESKAGVAVFEAAVAKDGLWSSAATTDEHLTAYFVAMRLYNPPPMTAKERPGGVAVIWAEKGMVNHITGDPKMMKMLADEGIPTKAYPGYMEDPRLSPMACLVPDKTKADLGPNGWDRYSGGEVLALSVDADHLDLPMPKHVRLLHSQLEKAFSHFADKR
ncbi:polyketide synthase pks13 [Agyrium rufum]|nr:polyketide synthase pks13 [Agyrium rufum]